MNKFLIDSVRKDFPVTNNYHYFQSAGMSPIPLSVYETYKEIYKDLSLHGDIFWQNDFDEIKKMYEIIASIVNTKPENIAIVENNSLAMSLLALMFKTKNSKFNVVSMEEEFPSNTVPFEYQSIEMRYVKHDNHRYDINHILSLCDENTLAVVTSYVQYCTGFRQDLYELGRELKKRDILFIVNATQAFPFFDIDINEMNIDVMTASVHKWGLCGHIGTLFITSEKFRTNYKSPIAGWLSVDVSASDNFIHNEKGVPFKLWDNAQQFQFGSSNLKNKLMLKYSLEYLNNIGIKQCRDYLLYISDYLLQALSNLDIEIISPHNSIKERSAIVSFSLKHGSNKKLVEYLENKRIIVALRNGYVRASVNIFTNKNDVDNLINAVLEYTDKFKI